MKSLRRAAVLVSVVAALVASPAAARGSREPAQKPARGASGAPGTAGPTPVYHEAPMLAARVSGGGIPALEKRLPKEPGVVEASGEGATYGGVWRQAVVRASLPSLWTSGIRVSEVRLGADLASIEAELLSRLEVSPDNRVFTFHLRPGLRWSDGDPCDAEDYAFYWQDVLLDPELTPLKPAELVAGAKLARFDKVDQLTVRYTFAVPNVMFLRRLAQPRAGVVLALPQHYMKQFHARYAGADKIDDLIAKGGYRDWAALFRAMAEPWGNPGLPVLDPWVARDDGSGGVLHLERNPYYWQVDEQGNQLPYIDGIEVTVAADIEACLVRAAAGEVDLQIADMAGAAARTRLEESAAAGVYRLVDVEPMHANIHTIFLNRTTPDAERARLFGDIRFRRALSLAVDRESINQAVHGGRCRPSQVAPPEGSPAYDAEAAALYTEHDVQAANALLDEVGLVWDAKHERRLGVDGKPIVLTAVFHLSWPPGQEDAMAMVRDEWREIGIELRSTVLGRGEWLELMRTEDWELSSYATNTGGGAYLYLSSDGVFPLDGYWFPAPEWGAWLSSRGTSGRQPPEEVKRLFGLYEEYVGTASGERAVEIEKEAFGLYADELLAIGLLTRPAGELFALVGNRMRNVPEGGMVDDLALYHPAVFFLAD